jgi:hypothetical protein
LEACKFTDSKDKKEYRELYDHNRKMYKAKTKLATSLFAKVTNKKLLDHEFRSSLSDVLIFTS